MSYNFRSTIRFCPHCAAPIALREIEGHPRPHCDACHETFYQDPKLAVAVLVDDANRLVLQRRKIDPGSGKWTFPSGYVERGERVEDAAIREVREETGLEICLTGLLGLYSHTGNPVVLAAYTAGILSGELAASDESDAVAYFAVDELPELAFEHDGEIIAQWLRLRGEHDEQTLDRGRSSRRDN